MKLRQARKIQKRHREGRRYRVRMLDRAYKRLGMIRHVLYTNMGSGVLHRWTPPGYDAFGYPPGQHPADIRRREREEQHEQT